MGDSFRSNAWDSQLDTMLDDLQQARITNGTAGHATHEYQAKDEPGRREVFEKHSRTSGGNGQPYSYSESSSRQFSSTTSMGTKRAPSGQMEQTLLEEKRPEQDSMRARSDSLVSDLSSIAKVRSVSKATHLSTERYESSTTTTSHTQQSIKKNITDLDQLLSNLSSHSAGPSRGSSKPGSREGSPNRRLTRTEERRERLISSASQYRTPSHSRPHSPGPTIQPQPSPFQPNHRTPEISHSNNQEFTSSTLRSQSSTTSPEFRPVHTTPDPLTGRYADGRITPNHGFTRSFNSSPMLPRKTTVPSQDLSIPKKPDELLSSLGQEVDMGEMQRITQEETVHRSQQEMSKQKARYEDEVPVGSRSTPGPPVFYPTGDLYTKNGADVAAREAELSAREQYFSASYSREKGMKSKEESGEKRGAAVIPICLPLCCAAPCVIM